MLASSTDAGIGQLWDLGMGRHLATLGSAVDG
jgi:hypothetical protein